MRFGARFTLRLADGTTWSGNVHGAGGSIAGRDARKQMEKLIQRANEGNRFVFAVEPLPGHVRGYQSTALSDDDDVVLDMRGATLLDVEA